MIGALLQRLAVASFIGLILTACASTWDSPTSIKIASADGKIYADAIVFMSADCGGGRCAPTGGSDVTVTLHASKAEQRYDVLLARGTCGKVSGDAQTLFKSVAAAQTDRDLRAHVDIPISPLVKRNYLLIVRDRKRNLDVACGPIHNDAAV